MAAASSLVAGVRYEAKRRIDAVRMTEVVGVMFSTQGSAWAPPSCLQKWRRCRGRVGQGLCSGQGFPSASGW